MFLKIFFTSTCILVIGSTGLSANDIRSEDSMMHVNNHKNTMIIVLNDSGEDDGSDSGSDVEN